MPPILSVSVPAIPGPAGPAGNATTFTGDQFQNPNNADWAVNAAAAAAVDSINPALIVRRFDDTAIEGVGIPFFVPAGAASLRFDMAWRAQTAPGAPQGVVPRVYTRRTPDNVAVPAWSAGLDLTTLAVPTSTLWQYDSQTLTLAALGLAAGEGCLIEFCRASAAAGDTLVGDWVLWQLTVAVV
ncbi:MAG: hypothetical protein IT371_30730 [Deltaproteobacteria bacterium]|nr:hypothetical protein [Deltaproteobacteria bacterium]